MHPSGTVLIYGHDPLLLRTRLRILEQAGYTVWTADVLGEVGSIITTNEVGLLIVCQTLSDEEGEAAITLAHHIRPEMKTLVMSLTRQRLLKTAQEIPFNVSTGPRNLLDTVQKLMGKLRENTIPERQGDNQHGCRT